MGTREQNQATAVPRLAPTSETALLEEFDTQHRTSPRYAFHHITTDGLWVVRARPANDRPVPTWWPPGRSGRGHAVLTSPPPSSTMPPFCGRGAFARLDLRCSLLLIPRHRAAFGKSKSLILKNHQVAASRLHETADHVYRCPVRGVRLSYYRQRLTDSLMFCG